MFLGIANAISGIKSGGLSFIKDNLKLYLDFKSNKSDTLKFPSEGSTSFDGSSDFIDCGDINDMDGASKITIAGWAKRLESNDRITFEKSTGTNDRVGLNLDTDGVLYANVGTGSGGAWAYASLSGTDWNHIAMVYDGTQADNATRLNIYINGVKQSSSYGNTIPATTASSAGTFKIGRAINNSNYSSTGFATNVAIWSRVLEPEEVQSIMNKSYSQLKGVEKTSLVAWWSLDQQHLNFNHVVNSVGEDLGSEEFRGSYAPLPYLGTAWEITGSSASVTEDATTKHVTFQTSNNSSTFSSESQFRGGKIEFTSANGGMLTGSAIAEQTYKVVISGYVSNANGQSIASYPYFYAGGHIYNSANVWTSEETTKTVYIRASHPNNDTFYPAYNQKVGQAFVLTGISVKKVNGHYGEVTGATTTTSVYGGNAPILPRAVDVAKEGQADAIGNGSASLNGSSDYCAS